MMKYILAFALIFTVVACGPPPPEEEEPPPPPPPETEYSDQSLGTHQGDPEVNISDKELQMFAETNIKAGEMLNNPEKDRVDLEAILEETELDPDRYNEIQAALQQDPQLRQKVQQIIREEQTASP